MDLSILGEVEVFRPGVAVVDDEFYWSIYMNSTSFIFTTVVDVLASNVPQDDCPLENLFQFRHIINGGAGCVDSLLPLLYFLAPCGSKSLAPQGTFEVFHDSLGHTVEVAVS